MVGSVFGILRHLRPSLWLRPMLNQAFRTTTFNRKPMDRLHVDFWTPVPPPSVRAHIEGASEVDVRFSFGNTVVLVEAKYMAPLSTRTTYDEQRDQLVRLLDVAYTTAVADQMYKRDPYVLVIGVGRAEPPLVTRYRQPAELLRMLGHYRRFPDHRRMAEFLARRVGYISWTGMANILVAARTRAWSVEVGFLDDVSSYLRHKVARADAQHGDQPALPIIGEYSSRTG
jgi:hypothetical protein